MQLSSRFAEAFIYAFDLHAAQTRKGRGEPYAASLLGVTALVLEHGGDEDEAIAALLHDAVEDQGGLPVLEEIRRRFGPAVAEIVDGCTDAYTIPKPPWRRRKEAFLAKFRNASPSVRLVAAADKLHNVRSLLSEFRRQGSALWQFFKGGQEGTLWYHRAIVQILKETGRTPLSDELERAVSELERLVQSAESS